MFIIFSISFSFFLFYNNNLAPQCGRPHNNGLYRTRLDRDIRFEVLLCDILPQITAAARIKNIFFIFIVLPHPT